MFKDFKFPASGGVTRRRMPAKSTHASCFLRISEIKRKAPIVPVNQQLQQSVAATRGKPAGGKPKGPPYRNFSAVFLQPCTIPYVYEEAPNTINVVPPNEEHPDIVLGGGDHNTTYFFSVPNMPNDIDSGALIYVRGLHYTLFAKNEGDEPRMNLCCVSVERDMRVIPSDLFASIPREARMFDRDLDIIMNSTPPMVPPNRYTFFMVDVSKGAEGGNPDGRLFGQFVPPPPSGITARGELQGANPFASKDPNVYSYVPYSGDVANPDAQPARQDIYSGGTGAGGTGVGDAEMVIGVDGEEKYFVVCRGRLYGDSIRRFMVGHRWTLLGPTLMNAATGIAFCVSDPLETLKQVYPSDQIYSGAIAASIAFYPDMGAIARACGVECSWRDAWRIVTPEPEGQKVFPDLVTAINIAEFTGERKYLEEAVAAGKVKLFIVSNIHDAFKAELGNDRDAEGNSASIVDKFAHDRAKGHYFTDGVAAVVIFAVAEVGKIVDYTRAPIESRAAKIQRLEKTETPTI